MQKIALVGCTGNIGRQVAETVRNHRDRFCFSVLVAGRDRAGLRSMAEEFHPRAAYVAADGAAEDIFDDCDVAFIAAGGFAGLRYTLQAAALGKKIALANKESLVCGGQLVTETARRCGAEIVPVDSEHSAIFQALSFRRDAPFERLVLTASGGPFLHFTEEQLSRVRAEDALKHPTWRMGAKITVDSATLLNKGYEIIEAKWLYGADFSRISAVVHPESIVHSLVCFCDGAAIAQLGYPDMRVPIQLALTYPERLPCAPTLDLEKLGALHFERLPAEKFPCYGLALEAGKRGGTAPTVLNAAAEEAVCAFLAGRIAFSRIAETVEDALSAFPVAAAESYPALEEADGLARRHARKFLYDD